MGQIQVNISLNDADTYGGINISNSMTLEVGDIVETGSYKLIVGESYSLVGRNNAETDPPYNEKGTFAYIKNTSTDVSCYIEVRQYIEAAEHSGSGGTIVNQRLYAGEWTWINAASPIASGTDVGRNINIYNNSGVNTVVDYAVFSRKNIGGPNKMNNNSSTTTGGY
jgi:hypothetical protein